MQASGRSGHLTNRVLLMYGYGARRAMLAIPLLSSIGVLGLMAFIARRRLDMVDESYLLRIIADPLSTRPVGEVYLFGFLLHPVYEVFGRDVAILRLIGFGVVALGAATLSRETLALLDSRGITTTRGMGWVISIVTAGSSMLVFSFNVTVPAYRSVALFGLLTTATGLVRAFRGRDWSGGGLLGLGLWVTFVGRPPSAAALLLVLLPVVLHLGMVRPRVLLGCGIALSVALGGTLAVAQMSVRGAAEYLGRGARHSELLGSHSDLLMMVGLGDRRLEGLLFFGPLVVVPLLAALVVRKKAAPEWQPLVELVGALVVAAWVGMVAVWAALTLGPDGFGWQFLSVGLLLPALAAALALQLRRSAGPSPRAAAPGAVILFLGALPWVSAVGSNVSFTVVMPLATVFWVLAIVVLALTHDSRDRNAGRTPLLLTFVATLVAAMTFVVHRDGLDGGDLGRGLKPAPVAGGRLLLPPLDAGAAQQIRAVTSRHGLSTSTPVVDLTGVGAGYAFMTGGRPLGRAHMYGYLPNSSGAAQDALATASCADRRAAWLIFAPRNPLDLSPAFTGDTLSLDTDYEVMARFTATSVRGTWQMRLLRPLPSVAARLGC